MNIAITLLQIVIITVAARAMAMVMKRIGQPAVVGEIAAGIFLGPSLFGAIAPQAFATVFPASTMPVLLTLSQIGLILFMFLVGLEFTPELVRERKHTVVVISHVSIIVPFILGAALAIYLYPRVSDPSVAYRSFVLFLGTAMSITAFPVLARILEDRDLMKTKVGSNVIACAAVDDVTAWCILAFVVMLARAGEPMRFALQLALLVVYIALMLFVVRPLLEGGLLARFRRASSSTASLHAISPDETPAASGLEARPSMLTVALLLTFLSAWATELLGIHALFGAFLAGAIMPRDAALHAKLEGQLRGLTTIIFLPLFFAVTGLRTNIGSLATPELWLCCALVLVVAIAGKLGGASLSAAAVGFSWREAGAIGVLMNTRGLMEMVVVNVGLEIGVVSPSLYTMIVIMALVTTAMTSPLLDVIEAREVRQSATA